jgi:hypothetical protein
MAPVKLILDASRIEALPFLPSYFFLYVLPPTRNVTLFDQRTFLTTLHARIYAL